jgi:hypothetical protein
MLYTYGEKMKTIEMDKKEFGKAIEKATELALDHMDEIKQEAACMDESQAASVHVNIFVYPENWNVIVERVVGDDSIFMSQEHDFFIFQVGGKNIYEWVDDPNDYTDEENLDSYMSSYDLEDEIKREIRGE